MINMILLVIKEDGTLGYREFEGDFTPSGYSPTCPVCGSSRTMFAMLVYYLFNSGWTCTECGARFTLTKEI